MRLGDGLSPLFPVIGRAACRHIRVIGAVCFLFLLILHLPKPRWLCCSDADQDREDPPELSFHDLSHRLRLRKPATPPTGARGGEQTPEHSKNVLRMFPMYAEANRKQGVSENSENSQPAPARVHLFTLKNHDFRKFNRFWENKPPGTKIYKQQHHKQVPENYDPGALLDRLSEEKTLPECVTLRFRRPLQPPTKACVHTAKEDNVISNSLRDFGHWEPDLLDQMQTFFEHTPTGQLVDLGCNLGVYTLLAARLGRPVLAIDVLPAHLALLHLSLLTNDRAALDPAVQDDVEDFIQSMVQARAAERKGGSRRARLKGNPGKESESGQTNTRPRRLFSQLVTIVHNAVYSRRTRMFVDITDDRNLGGMDVKELAVSHTRSEPAPERQPRGQGTGLEAAMDGRAERQAARDGPEVSAHNESQQQRDYHSGITNPSPALVVDAICLDDLVPYVQTNLSVFLKMDIEGAEAHALRCADWFFSSLDVRVVQMEILLQRYSGHLGDMNSFFERHNLWPSGDVNGRSMLGSDTAMWPDNIYWIKIR